MRYREIFELLVLSNIILFGSTLTFITLWIRARERAIRASSEPTRRVESDHPDLERLVNAVDAIAVEVERISEAPRFTTKVLGDRADTRPVAKGLAAARERVITPQ